MSWMDTQTQEANSEVTDNFLLGDQAVVLWLN